MPNVQCPHKKDAGYVTARRCTAPCKGWVVLYDRRKGALPHLSKEVTGKARWCLVHRDSWNFIVVDKKPDAMLLLEAAAKGEDPEGLLPSTLPKGVGESPLKAALTPPEPVKSEGNSASPQSESSHAGTREEDVPDALAFQRTLNEKFPPERIAHEVENGLTAVKTYQDKEGNVLEYEDHATRVKYLDLIFKYRIGMPDKREKPKETKTITYAELEKQIAISPAARRLLLRKIQEAEQASKPVASEKGEVKSEKGGVS